MQGWGFYHRGGRGRWVGLHGEGEGVGLATNVYCSDGVDDLGQRGRGARALGCRGRHGRRSPSPRCRGGAAGREASGGGEPAAEVSGGGGDHPELSYLPRRLELELRDHEPPDRNLVRRRVPPDKVRRRDGLVVESGEPEGGAMIWDKEEHVE